MKLISAATIGLISFILASCSTVPKEVVELSYKMGEDIAGVHASYKQLIHDRFDALRKERVRYVDEQWTPTYIHAWIEDGRLRDVVAGKVVWSVEKEGFVTPAVGQKEEALLSTVVFWSQAAINTIEKKKAELLDPLNTQEQQLNAWIDDAFNRLYRGNSTITAHLNSLRQVQEVQDNALAALNLKDLRSKINDMVRTISINAEKALDSTMKADKAVQKYKK